MVVITVGGTKMKFILRNRRRQVQLWSFLNKFLIFFPLKINLPERGLQLLLQFCLAFMTIICKRNGNGSVMGIKDELPTSVYMLRKQSSINKQFIQYCICTECETSYGMDQCIVQKNMHT